MWVDLLEKRIHFSHVALSAAIDAGISGAPDFVTTADFSGDGKLDLACSSYEARSLNILPGNGDGRFGVPQTIPMDAPPDFVTAADLNGDGKPDLLGVSFNANAVAVLLNDGTGNFGAPHSYPAGTGPRAAVVADFNHDGKPDVALAKSYDHALTVLMGTGSGAFGSPINSDLGFTPSDLVAGDFNGDGKVDLAAVDFFGDSVHILIGDGAGNFSQGQTISTGSGPSAIASADLNHDGKLDLVSANFLDATLSVLLGNGDGTFAAAKSLAAGRGATFVAIADIDGDGNPDLVSANANDDSIGVFLGHGDGNFDLPVTRQTAASPRSLVVADLNGDAAPDVAAANQGASGLSVFVSDETLPTAAVASAPRVTASGGSTYEFNIRYSDNIAIADRTLDGGDILVSGPHGFSRPASFVLVSGGTAAQRVATYRLVAPDGFWKPAANGTYTIQLQPGQVTDSAGNFVRGALVGSFTVSAIDAGNVLSRALGLGKLAAGRIRTWSDYVGPDDRNDYFSFNLRAKTNVYLKVSNLVDDADLMLLDASARRIAYSKRSGKAVEFIDRDLAAGTYAVRVLAGNGAGGTGYRLRLEGSAPLPPPSNDNTPAKAHDLGGLGPGVVRTADDFIGANDTNDYFRIRASGAITVLVKLTNLSDDADLQLLNGSGAVLGTSAHGGNVSESLKRKLSGAGLYYVRVYFQNGIRGTAYRLRTAAV